MDVLLRLAETTASDSGPASAVSEHLLLEGTWPGRRDPSREHLGKGGR